jgi:very-short-patch-repair endonuclease
MLKYNCNNKSKARALRSHMTDAEQLLWARLRRKQVLGISFYRQKPIGEYIVDFHAPAAKLVVEVDGSQHLVSHGRKRDERRDGCLRKMGLQILRFDNLQVLQETDAVMEAIYRAVEGALSGKIPPRSPLFQRGDESRHGAEGEAHAQGVGSVHPPLLQSGDENRHGAEGEAHLQGAGSVHSPLCKRGARGDLSEGGGEGG